MTSRRRRSSRRRRHVAILCLSTLLVLAAGAVHAATLSVGPNAPLRTIADAAREARDGDIVEIAAGVYRRDVAVWLQKRLTLRGVGGRVLLDADGTVAEGKAIWVFRDGDFAVEGIDFRGARADDRNGAGIRFERGRLAVRDCTFVDNENGILTSNDADAELSVENTEFAHAPRDRGSLKHLLYVGRIARFSLRGSYLHDAFDGHLVKSRARTSDVRYNMLVDGSDGRAAYELEFPNGGDALVVGNVIGQSASTTNPVVVAYGAEGATWERNALYLVHNTLTSDRPWGAWFLRVWDANFPQGVRVVATNNLTAGPGILSLGASGTFAGNVAVPSWVLADPAALDFSLAPDTWLRGWGVAPPTVDGASIAPTAEFQRPRGRRALAPPATWTPGAFQPPPLPR